MDASVNPYYLWALADKYSEIGLGEERGQNLVRINSLAKNNVPISFHSDFSMARMEPLTLAWTAVNRVTSQGSKFSQDQRVDVYTALQAITTNAARVLNLEHEIGSIEVRKTANFVLLDDNPLQIDPIELKDINVLGTVYRGQ
jgi:predicted amidohydrolase YtcJ